MGYELWLLIILILSVTALVFAVQAKGQAKRTQARLEEVERRQWATQQGQPFENQPGA